MLEQFGTLFTTTMYPYLFSTTDMEVLTIGDFSILARPTESIKPFLGTVEPVIVDDLEQTQTILKQGGAEIVTPITEAPTIETQSGQTKNSYRFAGEQFDQDLGEYYLRQRYYDTEAERFTSRDTYEGSLEDPISEVTPAFRTGS